MNNLTNLYPGGAASNVAINSVTDATSGFFWLILTVITIIALWKVFQKAGQAGWKSIIPVYNMVILCRIANLSGWFVILMLIPLVNIFMTIVLNIRLAKAFDRSGWFALGLILLSPIFLIILGFDKSTFKGPYYGTDISNAGSSDAAPTPAAAPTSAPIDTTATAAPMPERAPGELSS